MSHRNADSGSGPTSPLHVRHFGPKIQSFEPGNSPPNTHMGRSRFIGNENTHDFLFPAPRVLLPNGQLVACDQEPIRTPDAVQAYGVLIALDKSDGSVTHVSDNTFAVLKIDPSVILSASKFTDLLTNEEAAVFDDQYHYCLSEKMSSAFTLNIGDVGCFAVLGEPTTTNPDLLLLEVEPSGDPALLSPLSSKSAVPVSPFNPHTISRTLGNTTRTNNFTRNFTTPLPAGGLLIPMFDLLSQLNNALLKMDNLDTCVKMLAHAVRHITSYDRVMVYQFDSTFCGHVIEEAADDIRYLGLKFPASDIPQQARDLYMINKIRTLDDRERPTAKILCKSEKWAQQTLDMTYINIRAVSPVHIKYLGNMGVNASMSITLMHNSTFWGLIACHGYKAGRPSVPVRHFCKLLAETFGSIIEARQLRKSIRDTRSFVTVASNPLHGSSTVPSGPQVPTVVAGTVSDLLGLFEANFGILCVDGESKLLGETKVPPREIIDIVNFVKSRHFERISSTDRFKEFAPGVSFSVAGFLYIPLASTVTAGGLGDFVLFCRLEQVQTVNWAGDPTELVSYNPETMSLEPRTSFQIWRETVRGISAPWTSDALDMAGMVQLVYGRFMSVWREKEKAETRNRLKNLLIGSVSHDVRTPLNAVIGYLELALESPMDDALRENLSICYNASKSLIFIVNDLLDLTRFEAGKMLFRSEPFSLRNVISSTIPIFKPDAVKRGLRFEVACHEEVPNLVIGDGPKISQCLTNLCSNALKFTESGSITMSCKKVEETADTNILRF
ncbi:hypothetical protein SeMB42_g00422 [Synchytrium endobioticum]|uniref:Phytochrome chromophore attachment site domain-containing protein n=1 Tax=Synchytrium endobioticum TaxID=286115 RepID=A0A507DSG8_9FUNG|nr:hypothetical protein SeMB42_g00422 [Synchytrium endobioticum]